MENTMKNIFTNILVLVALLTSTVSYLQASNKTLAFNGTSSEVSFINNDLNLEAGNTMSVTAWVKWDNMTNAGSWANVVALNSNIAGAGDVGQFWLQHSQTNNKFEFAVNTLNARTYIQSLTTPLVGTWYHLAGVYNGSSITIYVNGVAEATTSLTGAINPYLNTFKLNMCQWANSENNYRRFNGDIDEVSIWNTALGTTDIHTMMCKSLKGTETGLIAYWPMNETSGTIVYDYTANARNGNNQNATIIESGSPVGNASVYTYGATSLSFKHPVYGDSLLVNNFSAAVTGIHIYRIDSALNVTTPPTGYQTLISYYYGVFVVNAAGQTYTTTYSYAGHPGVSSFTNFGLASRKTNANLSWAAVAPMVSGSKAVLTSVNQSTRNEYILATPDNALPVSLLSFNASLTNNEVQIEWTTISEKNNDFFTLEKSSDGIHFETLATVKGAGTSSSVKKYTYTDDSSILAIVYYRLAQTDFNGQIQYFNIVSVSKAVSSTNFELVKTYPNPFQEVLGVVLSCNAERLITIQIMSMNGTIFFQNTISCVKGLNSFSYDNASSLANGMYVINISDETGYSVHTSMIK
jgi:hypothetical protein